MLNQDPTTFQELEDYGADLGPGGGYASGKFDPLHQSNDGRHSEYPFGGYRSSFPEIFLNDEYYREEETMNAMFNIDAYFDRVQDGCEFTGVSSYRAVDKGKYDDDDTENRAGCVEEWTYLMSVVNDPSGVVFASPPIELYACDENESCSECRDKLRGPSFNGLALEDYDYPDGNYFVNCWIPTDYDLVNEDFLCYNEKCVFLSERYDYEKPPPETPEVEIRCTRENPFDRSLQCARRSWSIVVIITFLLIVACVFGLYVDFCPRKKGDENSREDEATVISSSSIMDIAINDDDTDAPPSNP
eukprot:CAMPEP_0197180800 /NCGR_PEP_ID=MMETSP1423-20130617/5281_1 /TAXON_ID=476441 /ORGANISM="Pseudo-nitzschia heimii, Strain UNC1101" /LENGTH=301 /DNA_ID=CAMNT_0042630925 /DNA_START=192 /DNA_END=1097 /DNA_ORIENTATION=+